MSFLSSEMSYISFFFIKNINLRETFIYTLSSSAIPASNTKTEKTRVLYGVENTTSAILDFFSIAEIKMDICADHTWPSVAMGIDVFRNALIDIKDRGINPRYITTITKDNLRYCKEAMKIGELRHLDRIKGNFAVSEKEYMASATMQEASLLGQVIYSNVKEFLEQQQYVFDMFWDKSVFAERKIREIENEDSTTLGGETEVIDNPLKTQELFMNLIKLAKSEVLLILPTANAFIREYRMGAIELLKELSTKSSHGAKTITSLSGKENLQQEGERRRENGGRQMTSIDVRILTPTSETIDKILHEMNITSTTITASTTPSMLQNEESSSSYNSNSLLQIRYLESIPKHNLTTVTILVVDRKSSLVIEKVDDSKQSFAEAVGLTTYSTSEPTIMSYISVFENFWNQIELYGKLKESGKSLAKSNKQLEEANEQLKLQSKVQKEFVNVAAHELRTPIVPILNLSELLYTRLKRRELQESDHLQQLERQRQLQLQLQQEQQMIQVIKRNAYRLHQLTEDILDVTKIESNSLKLKKELFDLNDTASNIINDLKVDISIRLLYETSQSSVNNKEEPFIVYADKGRITQVISNLLNNAVKFTKQGTITVKITKLDNIDHNLIISIKDSGSGIDPDILSRLFEKFVSKSDQGTGLGLYISKNIVEAHGGRIWAMNNSSDQRGCTFCFTLPLADLNQQRTRSSDDSGQ